MRILILILLFTLSCSNLKKDTSVLTITGIYGPKNNPFIIRIVEKDKANFKGILKWPKNKAWTYIEGEFKGRDSISFQEKENLLGYGVVLTAYYPGRIKGDSIKGNWIHRTHNASGNTYKAVINRNGPPLGDFEKDAWELFVSGKKAREQMDGLQEEIRMQNRLSMQGKTADKKDSLKQAYADLAFTSFNSGYDFFVKHYPKKDTLILIKETGRRIFKMDPMLFSKLNKTHTGWIKGLISEKHPEGSPFHYQLNKTLQNIKTKAYLDSMMEAHKSNPEKLKDLNPFAVNRDFYLAFMKKKVHPSEEEELLWSFMYGVVESDPKYKPLLLERIQDIKNRMPERAGRLDRILNTLRTMEKSRLLKPGDKAPLFSAKDVSGKKVNLAAYRGKVVCLEFWSVSCPPCVYGMKKMKEVFDKYKSRGFEIIGIALDTPKTLLKYFEENPLPWPNVADNGWEGEIAKKYSVYSMPSIFLIDRKGFIGAKTHPLDSGLEENIERLL
jgi:peroxiredoxin